MPACPVCRDDFEDDIEVCPTDRVALVPGDQLPAVAEDDASLGVFHPVAARTIIELATRRGVPVRVVTVDDERAELRVPASVRDRLRADLAVRWGEVVAAVAPDDRARLTGSGDRLVGWHDAPGGAWVDDHGRVRVDASAEEEATIDAQRRIGPALAIVGALGLLLAWLADGGEVMWLLAGAALVLGLLLPV